MDVQGQRRHCSILSFPSWWIVRSVVLRLPLSCTSNGLRCFLDTCMGIWTVTEVCGVEGVKSLGRRMKRSLRVRVRRRAVVCPTIGRAVRHTCGQLFTCTRLSSGDRDSYTVDIPESYRARRAARNSRASKGQSESNPSQTPEAGR